MTFEEYQKESRKTAIYPNSGSNLVYPVLGLAGEVGEVAEKVKKAFRDDGGVMSDERKAALRGELGDVLWYVAQVATELGLSLEEVAKGNIEKLFSRKERGTLHGDGDTR
ncbi:MAG: nucleoside triphosphate pyrophosphohydrolase family protein [Candidatus Liptonbacteria bacterium]|nr:nucleoside triphosphate pyrophosphohydrolase family protein [Candidatus Liptonbacteria bacterium]